MAKKPLDDEDISLWSRVAASVTPILRRRMPASPPAEEVLAPAVKARKKKTSRGNTGQQVISSPRKAPPELQPADLDTAGFGGISRSSARAIKSGQAGFTSRLDLHGLSRDQAYIRLVRFLTDSASTGHRHVLIITGKGARGGGVIRREFPGWITAPPLNGLVIAYCQAQPKDGGAGAWYVNLRRS